ncbi:hypothetical protein GBA52_014972 [Prunus armeniaca]|nr:hypothetical protein GBA52_014972 [Prunus armeniaca]
MPARDAARAAAPRRALIARARARHHHIGHITQCRFRRAAHRQTPQRRRAATALRLTDVPHHHGARAPPPSASLPTISSTL